MENLEEKRKKKIEKEIQVIDTMIQIYCRKKHKTSGQLCEECDSLLQYAVMRINKCPFMIEKTFCSSCKVHCYAKEQRKRIKEVMKFSGPRMLFVHPILVIRHVYYSLKDKLSKK